MRMTAHRDAVLQINKSPAESLMKAIELAQRATSFDGSYANVLRKAGLK
jgi:hypothetical protein